MQQSQTMYRTLGEEIRRLMVETNQHFTQLQLSQKTGLNLILVNHIMQSTLGKQPTLEQYQILADLFNTNVKQLIDLPISYRELNQLMKTT